MNRARFALAGAFGALVLRLLFMTTRRVTSGSEHFEQFRRAGAPVLFLFWHGSLLPLAWHHRGEGIVVLVSEHADGEYIARIIERLGFGTARGSSTRGGSKGLRGLLRAARAGRDLAVTPDGPRGPARVLKPGSLAVAAMAGLPVIPISVRPTSAWRLGSWDGFVIPKPFSRITIEYLPPVRVPRVADGAVLEETARAIEARLGGAGMGGSDSVRGVAS